MTSYRPFRKNTPNKSQQGQENTSPGPGSLKDG